MAREIFLPQREICLDQVLLISLSMFLMGLYLLQDGVHGKIDSIRSRFFWQGPGEIFKHHMVDWEKVCTPKESVGLGILNTKIMNVALSLKWFGKFSKR